MIHRVVVRYASLGNAHCGTIDTGVLEGYGTPRHQGSSPDMIFGIVYRYSMKNHSCMNAPRYSATWLPGWLSPPHLPDPLGNEVRWMYSRARGSNSLLSCCFCNGRSDGLTLHRKPIYTWHVEVWCYAVICPIPNPPEDEIFKQQRTSWDLAHGCILFRTDREGSACFDTNESSKSRYDTNEVLVFLKYEYMMGYIYQYSFGVCFFG